MRAGKESRTGGPVQSIEQEVRKERQDVMREGQETPVMLS